MACTGLKTYLNHFWPGHRPNGELTALRRPIAGWDELAALGLCLKNPAPTSAL